MTLRERINDDMKTAMKARETDRLAAIRLEIAMSRLPPPPDRSPAAERPRPSDGAGALALAGTRTYTGTTLPSDASASITTGSLAGDDTISYSYANTSSANVGTFTGLVTASVSNTALPTKTTTTVALDFGRVTISEPLVARMPRFTPSTGPDALP